MRFASVVESTGSILLGVIYGLALGAPLPGPLQARNALVVFVVTAVWDVALRRFALGEWRLLGIEQWGWVRDLAPYFNDYTTLEAAAVAGAVGAMAYFPIAAKLSPDPLLRYAWVLFVSTVVGLPMRAPLGDWWFASLRRTYYDKRPVLTLATDGMSGVIVAVTMDLCRIALALIGVAV